MALLHEDKRIKAITYIPGWSELFETNKVSSAAEAYGYVPIIYRALRLRCNALAKVPVTILQGENEVDWPFPSNLYDLLWWTEAALLLAGAAYWEKVGNEANVVKNVVWRNPFSIDVTYDSKKKMLEFKQPNEIGGAKWTNDLANGKYEMVYFREFDPTNDLLPGVAAANVALTNSQLIRYLTRFGAIFFEQGAMPVVLLPFENIAEPEAQRVEGFFKKMTTGVKNAWRVLALRGMVDPKIITPPLKDLVIPELYEQARREVADAFEVPLPLLENPANRSVTEELRLSFYQDTVEPRGSYIESVVNTQLLKPLGMEMKLEWEKLSIYQEDEEQRSASLESLTTSGMPLDIALEVLGFHLSEEQWERVRPKPVEPVPELPPALPTESNQAMMLRAELDRWRRKSLKAIKVGKNAAVKFESNLLSFALQGAIDGQLESASTVEAVNAVFDSSFLGYP